MKRFGLTTGMTAVLAGSLLSTSALAGLRTFSPVTIDDSVPIASGQLGSTYSTTDRTQYIECKTAADTSNTPVGWCFAVDTNRVFRSCVTMNANLVAIMRSINSQSFVSFNWNVSGQCTGLAVTNSSTAAVNQP